MTLAVVLLRGDTHPGGGHAHATKEAIFLAAGGIKKFRHLVGKNPDIDFRNGTIWLKGVEEGFKGKYFDTGLSILDFFSIR